MVYRGPSKGCKVCKTRRVKCDETRPACKNCTTQNVTCPGFPATFQPGERIIDETGSIIKASKNKHRCRPRPEEPQSQLVRGLSEDEVFISVCFFFGNYAMRDRGIQSTRSELKYLPDIYASAAPESTVSAAITALTLSFLSMWRGNGPESTKSQYHANRAISSLRQTLTDPIQSRSDVTLLAIMMLQFRETIVGTAKIQPGQGDHQRGAYAVVKHRGTKNFNTRLSKELVQSLRNSTVIDAIFSRRRVDITLPIWEITEDLPEDPNDTLAWLGVIVANLQAEFEEYQEKLRLRRVKSSTADMTVEDLEAIESFKRAAAQAEQSLIQWDESQSPLWKPVSLSGDEIPPSVREAGLYRGLCRVYPSISISGIWGTYRLERIVLLKIMICCDRARLRGNNHGQPDGTLPSARVLVSLEHKLQQLVDDTCAAVPFHLGNRRETGSIDEFGDMSNVEYPIPRSDKDPWRNQPASMSTSERKREILALGCWHLLGPLGFTLKILNESADLWADGDVVTKVGTLLRDGQMLWMFQQFRRILIVQKMIGKDSSQFL